MGTVATLLPLALKLSDFWLPANYSEHGTAIDAMFTTIAWITGAVFIGVHVLLVFFLVRYRHRKQTRKARYIHGNIRLEIVWMVIPAIILLLLAAASARVWDNYRYSRDLTDPKSHHVLVIAQQFNWNFIYAGSDNKLGKYLEYPRLTDAAWPRDARGHAVKFFNIDGPARLDEREAGNAIRAWISDNPFGKVLDPALDPDGVDDDVTEPQGVLTLPVGETTVLDITSKDVIHDFYLPNFRVNVYAVPGMHVQVCLRPTRKSSDFEESRVYALDDLPAMLADPANVDFAFEIDETAPGELAKNKEKDATGWRYFSTAANAKTTIIRNGRGFPRKSDAGRMVVDAGREADIINALRSAGIRQVRGHVPFYWEIECAQLCGVNHTAMEGKLYVIDAQTWARKYEPPKK